MRESGCRKSYTLVFCLFLKRKTPGTDSNLRKDFSFKINALNTKSKSRSALVKSSPNIGKHWKDLKAIGSVFLSPTNVTMHEQLFELESVLSECSHVCPTDWMSCIREGFKTLFLITFKCSAFWESPLCNNSRCEALMIRMNSRQRKLRNLASAATTLPSLLLCRFPRFHPEQQS